MPTGTDSDEASASWIGGVPRIAGATHVGVVRRINQDAFGRFDLRGGAEVLVVVADGLGGHRGGEVASRMAVEWLGKLVPEGDDEPAVRLTRAITEANERVLKAAKKDRTLDGMGTTVVCLLLEETGRSYVAHVGDSRLYRLRRGEFVPLTEDHSLVATLVRQGMLSPEEAKDDPRRNQILRALGVREDLEIEIAPIELEPGDLYLLCSDGLHGLIEDEQIQELIGSAEDLDETIERLITAANEAGGTDNVTCMLARVPEAESSGSLRAGAARLIDSTRSLLTPKRSP